MTRRYQGRGSRSCAACILSPTTGFEPPLDYSLWNVKDEVRESQNCLAYAMNKIDQVSVKECKDSVDCNVGFSQPGYASGSSKLSDQVEKRCGDMVSRIWGDTPAVTATSFNDRCPYRTSKIALIVDPKRDYHFLRQDPDGYWSHKPGAMHVTRLDASNRPILRPDRALFMYTKRRPSEEPLTYTRFCGYFCVPRTNDVPIHMSRTVKKGGHSVLPGSSHYRSRYLVTRKQHLSRKQ